MIKCDIMCNEASTEYVLNYNLDFFIDRLKVLQQDELCFNRFLSSIYYKTSGAQEVFMKFVI